MGDFKLKDKTWFLFLIDYWLLGEQTREGKSVSRSVSQETTREDPIIYHEVWTTDLTVKIMKSAQI